MSTTKPTNSQGDVLDDGPFPPEMLNCIEEFFLTDKSRTPGMDVYQDVFDTRLFFPLQRQCETAEMIRIARSISPKVVMEIGADKGGSLYHWIKCLPTVNRVIASEVRGTPYASLFEKEFPTVQFHWTLSSYRPQNVSAIKDWLGNDTIDVLFIDGNKTTFELDFYTYLPSMSQGGIVFMHDITDRCPKEAYINVINRGYAHRTIVDQTDTHLALERESLGLPPSSPHEEWLRHWKGKSCGVGVIYL